MSMDDYNDYLRETAMEEFLQDELRRISEEPVFGYLAVFGDAIENRVKRCIEQAETLSSNGYHGAALTRAATGIEITIRFFLTRPLVQGAFLSDEWADLLSKKVLSGRTAGDRELLPAILRNWDLDITKVKLSDGSPVWERIKNHILPMRNDYVHKAADAKAHDAFVAIECLKSLLSQVVDPISTKLGFTRDQTGCWSIVNTDNPPDLPNLNPPRTFTRQDPFL